MKFSGLLPIQSGRSIVRNFLFYAPPTTPPKYTRTRICSSWDTNRRKYILPHLLECPLFFEENTLKNNRHHIFDQSMQWLSRTIAVVIVMVSPGLIGMFFDKRLGIQFLTPVGFLIGTALATVSLLVIAQKLAPPAGGAPIPYKDEDENDKEERNAEESIRRTPR